MGNRKFAVFMACEIAICATLVTMATMMSRESTDLKARLAAVEARHHVVDNAWAPEKIVGRGPKGGPQATVVELVGAAGLWCDLTPAAGEKMAAVYVEKDTGPVIGLNGSKFAAQGPTAGHDLSFYLADGKPFMQVRRANGTLEHVAMEELADVVISTRKKDPPRPLPERVVHADR